MNLNILHPGKAVESAFEKPNILLALILVLLPPLASIAGKMVYGVDATGTAAYEIMTAYVTFFALLLVIYTLAMLFDAKKTKGKFTGAFSALALIQLTQLSIIIISLLAIPLIFQPETIAFAKQASQSASTEAALTQLAMHIEENPGAINTTNLAAFMLLAAGIATGGIILLYSCIKKLTEARTLPAVLLTIAAIIILGLLPI